MKILWITNILFPEAQSLLSGRDCLLNHSGGWMTSAAEKILSSSEHSLVVASVSPMIKMLTRLEGQDITYYALPCKNERKYHQKFEAMWKEIVAREHPDIVHIYGTEFAHGLAFLRIKSGIPTVISIQGVMSAIGQYYLEGLSSCEIVRHTTPVDLFVSGSLFAQKRRYIKYGRTTEREMIKCANMVIGRTGFDRARVLNINPEANYCVCNETLRPEFYDGKWTFDKCRKHTVFISQANYPVKGLHQLLKAMPELIRRFPDIQVRIAGTDITNVHTLKAKILQTTYSRLICSKIKKLNLINHITFLGALSAKEMKRELLATNLFLCTSTVENSPNSLGEAQLLGVPCIASFAGGIPDFFEGRSRFLFRFDEIPELQQKISDCFEESESADNEHIRESARKRHDPDNNMLQLLRIYDTLKNDGQQ